MTFAKARDRAGLLPVLLLASAAVITLSVHFSMAPVALSPVAEAGIVGGSTCGFAEGFALGMGVAGLFGCVVCGVGSVILGAGILALC